MQSLPIKLMLAGLLIGCAAPAKQQTKTSKAVSKRSSISADTAIDHCDFSAYAPVRIEQFNRKTIIKRVQPEYPAEAVQSGVQGRVTVKALINRKGLVEKACAIEGDQMLRGVAERAALQWKLQPGSGLAFTRPKTEKNPTNFAEVYIVFDFKLGNKGSNNSAAVVP